MGDTRNWIHDRLLGSVVSRLADQQIEHVGHVSLAMEVLQDRFDPESHDRTPRLVLTVMVIKMALWDHARYVTIMRRRWGFFAALVAYAALGYLTIPVLSVRPSIDLALELCALFAMACLILSSTRYRARRPALLIAIPGGLVGAWLTYWAINTSAIVWSRHGDMFTLTGTVTISMIGAAAAVVAALTIVSRAIDAAGRIVETMRQHPRLVAGAVVSGAPFSIMFVDGAFTGQTGDDVLPVWALSAVGRVPSWLSLIGLLASVVMAGACSALTRHEFAAPAWKAPVWQVGLVAAAGWAYCSIDSTKGTVAAACLIVFAFACTGEGLRQAGQPARSASPAALHVWKAGVVTARTLIRLAGVLTVVTITSLVVTGRFGSAMTGQTIAFMVFVLAITQSSITHRVREIPLQAATAD